MYRELKDEFHTKYIYGALECAAAKLKQYKRTKRKRGHSKIPYISKNVIKLDNRSYRIDNDIIRIPIRARQYCYIKLNYYVLEKITEHKLGSITITPNKIIFAYSKNIQKQKPEHFVALDRNLNNTTTVDTKGNVIRHELQDITRIKEKYRHIRSKFKRNDIRIRKKIFQKYGNIENNKIKQRLHCVSKKISRQNMGVVMEDLGGIRRLYQKGNKQNKKFRAKMNSWPFYELQRQVEYKVKWYGLPVIFVKAYGTSTKCSVCDAHVIEENRMIRCPKCKNHVDRDINAARNILARGIRVMPDAIQEEAVKQSKDVEQIVLNQIQKFET
jgi:putative transposase